MLEALMPGTPVAQALVSDALNEAEASACRALGEDIPDMYHEIPLYAVCATLFDAFIADRLLMERAWMT
jgi:hypothetical protein